MEKGEMKFEKKLGKIGGIKMAKYIKVDDKILEKLKADENYKNDIKVDDSIDEKNFITKSRFNEINDKYKAEAEKSKTLQKQVDETKTMLEGSEEYKTKYESLNEKYSNDIQLKDKEIANTSKRYLLDQKLRESGARHTRLLMKEIDLDKITVENDNLLGFDSTLESLKKDYSDMFEIKKSTNNVNTGNNNLDNNEEFNNIDWAAKAKEYLD
jgi:hypothetical protein